MHSRFLPLLGVLLSLGCSSDSAEPPPVDSCATGTPIGLAPGQHVVVDPALTQGCIAIAGSAAPEQYLAVAFSGSGLQVTNGISGSAAFSSGSGLPSTGSPVRVVEASPNAATQFHHTLRFQEAAASSHVRTGLIPPRLSAPPAAGDARTFQVCASTRCDAFVPVSATARWVGRRGAIYLDDTVPGGGLTDADLAGLGALFDDFLYPIDTTAFGRESDLDGNGVVIILLTDAINALSGNCADGSVIQGYFFGRDLLPGDGSNGGEVFYSRVPDAANPACSHTRTKVLESLPSAFVHEFQHMISFNQKVLLQGGAPEHGWLNEALSHFAEELAWRQVPGDASTFIEGDVYNAFDYLRSPVSWFLVTPATSDGTPAERGAQWLFLRWLADHASADTILGTGLTRALLASRARGEAAVSGVSGRPFSDLVGAWQLANWLDGLDGFTGHADLRYRSIDLRGTMRQLGPVFPLRPDSVGSSGYARTITLRAGSGKHVRLVCPCPSPLTLRLTAADSQPLDPLLVGRIAIARIR